MKIIKRFAAPIVAVLLTVLFVEAVLSADLTQGHVFTPGEQNITHVEMNQIAGAATINTTFFTDKSSLDPDGADVLLYYSIAQSGFRKTTLNAAVINNIDIITTQAEDSSPAYNDLVLIYDSSAGTFKKVALQNLLSNPSTNLFANFPTVTTPILDSLIPLSEGSTNARVSLTNLLYMARTNFDYTTPFTNLPVLTTPTNGDALLVWDSAHNTNKEMSALGLATNLLRMAITNGAGATLGSTNIFPITSGGQLQSASVAGMSAYLITAQQVFNDSTFTSGEWQTNSILGSTAADITASKAVLWNARLTCLITELGYAVGDVVSSSSIQWDANRTNNIAMGYSTTNAWVRLPNFGAGFPKIIRRDIGTYTNLNTANWRLNVDMIVFK